MGCLKIKNKMKKILLILAIFASIGLAAQGTLKENGIIIDPPIAQYDLSDGDTEWIINLNSDIGYSYKWCWYANFLSLTGTLDGTLEVFASADEGVSWLAYPNMRVDTVSTIRPYSFADEYTVYDKIKIVLTVNNISGGTADPNIRLITNPKK